MGSHGPLSCFVKTSTTHRYSSRFRYQLPPNRKLPLKTYSLEYFFLYKPSKRPGLAMCSFNQNWGLFLNLSPAPYKSALLSIRLRWYEACELTI